MVRTVYTTTASMTLHVDVSCDGCGTAYGYRKVVSKTTSSSGLIGSLVPGPSAEQQVRDELQKGRFGIKPCPKCGYLQGYMQKEWLDQYSAIFAFLAAGLVVPAAALLFGWPDNISLLNVSMALLGYAVLALAGAVLGTWIAQQILVPNRRWKSRHPDKQPRWNAPRIVAQDPQQDNSKGVAWDFGGGKYCNYDCRPIEVNANSAFQSVLYSFAKLQMICYFPIDKRGEFFEPGALNSNGPLLQEGWRPWVEMIGVAIFAWPFIWIFCAVAENFESKSDPNIPVFTWGNMLLSVSISTAAVYLFVTLIRWRVKASMKATRMNIKKEIHNLELRYSKQCGEMLKKYPSLVKAGADMQKLHDPRIVMPWAIRHIGYRPWSQRQQRAMQESQKELNRRRIKKLLEENPCLQYLNPEKEPRPKKGPKKVVGAEERGSKKGVGNL